MADIDDEEDTQLEEPAEAEISIEVDGQTHVVKYEKAFALGCSLLKKGQAAEAAKVFERLEEFTDRGPRAFIMQAFCEAGALHFDKCSAPLVGAFSGESQQIATAMHNAFVSYHVGIRQDALNAMVELVNQHRDLPTLCLLLGDMLESSGQLAMARKCWSLAVHRDREGGAVAAVAMRHLRKSPEE
jgi:hypothetical protein